MKKRKFSMPVILGLVLVLCSLCLVLFFQIRTRLGAQTCQQTAETLSAMIPERSAGVPGSYLQPRMPVLQIDSADYVALLEIPSLDITLPVADQWDSNRLSYSPARFFGSAYDGTLVIGGTDGPGQFRFCDKIDQGVTLTVTDMTGGQFTYTVARVDRSKEAETQWLTQSDWDLTLFCRDQQTLDYLAVRCISDYR